jgi:hypothetical protein
LVRTHLRGNVRIVSVETIEEALDNGASREGVRRILRKGGRVWPVYLARHDDTPGPTLVFSTGEWVAFLVGANNAEFYIGTPPQQQSPQQPSLAASLGLFALAGWLGWRVISRQARHGRA